MTPKINIFLGFISMLLSSTLAAQCQIKGSDSLYQLEKHIEYYRLANGLQVRLLPLADKQTVTLASQFNVGARNEAQGESGYAHLFEHMLFKGSEQAPGDTYAQQLTALGSSFNASTHFDYTNYFETLPTEAVELALFLDADRFIRPSLNAITVKNQQETVLQEMAQRIDNQPYIRSAMEVLLAQVKDTPYGHGIIGTKEDIIRSTPESLTAFHRAYYRPDAMQLTLVGKFPGNTKALIEQNFGQWQAPLTPVKEFNELNIQPIKVHAELVDERGPWPGLLLAWHTVGKNHPDAAAVKLLESLLFQNIDSELAKISQHDPAQLISYSLPFELENHGITNLILVPRARTSLDELVAQVQGIIAQSRQTPLSEIKLCELKQGWLNQQLTKLDDTQSIATMLSATAIQDSIHPLTGQWQRINVLTAEDLQRVAQTYFGENYLRVDLLPPWYIRLGKTLLEWLPDSVGNRLEEIVL
ncbi:insulinase family protein [Shewanella sp. A25]|nr:insulinase family protein [Shewanella shenzhenensis]